MAAGGCHPRPLSRSLLCVSFLYTQIMRHVCVLDFSALLLPQRAGIEVLRLDWCLTFWINLVDSETPSYGRGATMTLTLCTSTLLVWRSESDAWVGLCDVTVTQYVLVDATDLIAPSPVCVPLERRVIRSTVDVSVRRRDGLDRSVISVSFLLNPSRSQQPVHSFSDVKCYWFF